MRQSFDQNVLRRLLNSWERDCDKGPGEINLFLESNKRIKYEEDIQWRRATEEIYREENAAGFICILMSNTPRCAEEDDNVYSNIVVIESEYKFIQTV